MDINTLMKLVQSSGSIGALTQVTGVNANQVSGVLNSVMPMLLNGASAQANNQATASAFQSALDSHGVKDTLNLGSFLGGVDLADGAKIVQHLLGSNSTAAAVNAAKAAGISQKDVMKIMAMVAPLLLAILGQQKKKHPEGTSALLQAVLGGTAGSALGATDVLGILGKLMKK